jgi:crotonobetainyl-CoA:carnitine CoA-transferase CaiB-like acyl-CoA transferase
VSAGTRNGPLTGLRVVELASEMAAYAGKLLGEMGAEVVLVEPPGGHWTRWIGPFLNDQSDPDNSMWWWHYNVGKRNVVLDLDDQADAELCRRLIGSADVVLEAEPPDRLGALGLDHPQLRADNPGLMWASVTPFGREDPRSRAVVTDLTVQAAGGPAWSCGYDDHSLPPVRGGGNQGFQTGSVWAVLGVVLALVNRNRSGLGQHIDVSLHAGANATTEAGTYSWLVAQATVQRQTGRHATSGSLTGPTQAQAADGRWVSTGVPPQTKEKFAALLRWLEELDLSEEFGDLIFLQMGAAHGIQYAEVGQDVMTTEIMGAGREALILLASRLSAYDFFIGAQECGIPCGVIYSPEEAMADPHFVDRGMAVEVFDEMLGRTVVYPGAPLVFAGTDRSSITPAPRLGEARPGSDPWGPRLRTSDSAGTAAREEGEA